MTTARTCSVEGCDKKNVANGLCRSCYYKKWANENPDLLRINRKKWKDKNKEIDKEYQTRPRITLNDSYVRRRFNIDLTHPYSMIELGRKILQIKKELHDERQRLDEVT